MRRFVAENSLSIVFGVLFLGALGAQSVAGWHAFNAEQLGHHEPAISYSRYLLSSDFGNAMLENWQSEYLQFALYFVLTVWFVQRGSPESKAPGEAGLQPEERQRMGRYAQPDSPRWAAASRGLGRALYSSSLLILMAGIWLASWLGQSLTGWSDYSSRQLAHGERAVSWLAYLATSDFWEATLQNWQSEFLAIGSAAVFSVFLRQRGSPESKPVGAPHEETGAAG